MKPNIMDFVIVPMGIFILGVSWDNIVFARITMIMWLISSLIGYYGLRYFTTPKENELRLELPKGRFD